MRKHDVKAIFLIFIILLLISAMAIFGITTYVEIMREQGDEKYALFEGNTTTLPTGNENSIPLVTPTENEIANQNTSNNTSTNEPIANEIQNTPNNTPVTNEIQNTPNNTPITNEIQNTPSNTTSNKPTTNNSQNVSTSESTGKEEYYYKQLNSYAKIIYNTLKNNKENLKTGTYKIDFGEQFDSLLSEENGTDLLQEYYQSAMETYLYDNPDVFYLDPTKMYINIQTTKKVFYTTYEVFIDCGENANYLAEGYSSKQQILEYENQIAQEVQKILQKTKGKNTYQKIQIIHDYLVDNISYEQTISKANIYNMYGALVNKECVCEGYAKAFKYLMDQIGVESIVVIGSATDSDGKTQNHAWNYVKFNGIWYAIDVTWDDPILIGGGILSTKHRYKYFLKGSETMSEDHIASNTFVENGKVYTHPTLSVKDYE